MPDFTTIVRPGDAVIWGDATSEPLTLTEALIAQRREIGAFSVFLATHFSGTLKSAHAADIDIRGLGGLGRARDLCRDGAMQVIPAHFGQIGTHIRKREIACDVALAQVSPPNASGQYSFGLAAHFIAAAMQSARRVVIEVNDQIPWTHGETVPDFSPDALVIETSRTPIEVPAGEPTETDRAIARHIAHLVPDTATLQIGIGGPMRAVMESLGNHRDLGFHSGLLSDPVMDLIEAGVITNSRKRLMPGVSVAGGLYGTRRLYDWANHNPSISLRSTDVTHDAGVLAQIDRLVSVNSAISVDLTGQINAEMVGSRQVGAIGGQPDFMRAAQRSPGGLAIIALPSTADGGKRSRIMPTIDNVVTTPRCDADVVVTEYGYARLRAKTFAERAAALIAIAHPDFREELARAWHRAM